jgi:hypothetical protein
MIKIFISYQTNDKIIAGKLKSLLESYDLKSFLAHEDIQVSEEWKLQILREISESNMFISLLSEHYMSSPWCIQESGIAVYKKMKIIPLSLDGTIPMGFMNHVQSTKIDSTSISIKNLLPAFIKYDFNTGISIILKILKESTYFRLAETNYELIMPYISKIGKRQAKQLIKISSENNQIYNAHKCQFTYFPQVLKQFAEFSKEPEYRFLKRKIVK